MLENMSDFPSDPFVRFPLDVKDGSWKCPYCKHTYRFARTHVFKKHYIQVTMNTMRAETEEQINKRIKAQLRAEIENEMPFWDGT
jgi:glutaredoxin